MQIQEPARICLNQATLPPDHIARQAIVFRQQQDAVRRQSFAPNFRHAPHLSIAAVEPSMIEYDNAALTPARRKVRRLPSRRRMFHPGLTTNYAAASSCFCNPFRKSAARWA